MLIEAEQKLRARGVELWLAAVNPGVRRILERSSLGTTLGTARIHRNLHTAFEAYRKSPASVPAG
jgi:SulP family sulfate permease